MNQDTGEVWYRDERGRVIPAEPIPMRGWKARLETFFYKVRLKRAAKFMGRWDERKLGR